MSETSPIYFTPPPALLTPDQLAAITDALAGERQSCADEPATPLGYWPTAVAALLGHATVLAGRVKEQQAELAEQEKHKLLLVLDNKSLNQRLTDALDSLGDMYDQYCPGKYGHDFMSAGEGAQDVLGQEGLLDDDFNFSGIPSNPAA